MLYRDWDRFRQACDDLCRDSDTQAGLLVFKVTDDRKCLTFRTRSSTYLNRFDALNRALLQQYRNKRRPSLQVDGLGAPPPSLGPAQLAAGAVPTTIAEPSDDGAAKAKKRRGKKKAK
ncbi:hypothetical protein JCM10449v2_007341 [Rhodotorula kratochvilovae]